MNPNPEAFARTVLLELAHLRGESLATRTRLYQLMQWLGYPQPIESMMKQDDKRIEDLEKLFLNVVLPQCGLSGNPTSTDSQPPVS